MKLEIEFRGQTFNVFTEGREIKTTPSFTKVGLPRKYLEEASLIQTGAWFKIVLGDSLTDTPIKLVNDFERIYNFLLSKGAIVITKDFLTEQEPLNV